MIGQMQLATTSVTPMPSAARALPNGIIAHMHNANALGGASITAEMYINGNGSALDGSKRIWAGTIIAGATQPISVRGQLLTTATIAFKASAAGALNVLLLEGSP